MEKRRVTPSPGSKKLSLKGAPLPIDYVKMVTEVFVTHFTEALATLKKLKKKNRFVISGSIYPDEILLTVSLVEEGVLSATSAHASCDFDPTASQPTAEDLLAACVDALASLFSELLPADPKKLAEVIEQPLSEFKDVPFDWTPMTVNKREIFLRVDKLNPTLEQMADEWLDKNDPDRGREIDEEQEEGEDLLSERLDPSDGTSDPTQH